jgi:signal transduction histidine kinase
MALIEGDSVHLRRVFTNLLDNAIKFSTRGGTINISCDHRQKDVAVTVRDEGPGISPEELPYIFDAFHRGRIGERIKGFGLGLASVKAVVEAHGGKVLVESEPGRGSLFTVLFPKAPDP